MNLSVGLLYTGKDLIKIFSKYKIPVNLAGLPKVSFVASYVDSVNISLKCGWLEIGLDNNLKPSKRGLEIIRIDNFQESMRLQIEDFIEVFQPRWAKIIPHGRFTAINMMAMDQKQCFREAGLLENPPSKDVVQWWDKLSAKTRGQQRDLNNEIGRKGEQLSIAYEFRRVGITPKWQSIESNSDGYDLISIHSLNNNIKLTIEVKATTKSIKWGCFYLTRNEWFFALNAKFHQFHLWSDIDTETPKLACLTINELNPHIPHENGLGKWESVKIPFHAIEHKFFEIIF